MTTTGYYYGGTIPYYISEGVYYILLGRESKDNTWSPFGGVRDEGENILEVVVRESWEETMGLLGTVQQLAENVKKTSVGMVYRHQDQSRNIDHWSFQAFLKIPPKIATNLPEQFSGVNQYNRFCDTGLFRRNGCHEKTEIKWFPIAEVIRAVKTNNLIYGSSKYPVRDVFDLTLIDGDLIRCPFHDGDTSPEQNLQSES